MAFIKHGDGKIVSVIKEKDLSKKQKEVVEDLVEKLPKSKSDTSNKKKSGS